MPEPSAVWDRGLRRLRRLPRSPHEPETKAAAAASALAIIATSPYLVRQTLLSSLVLTPLARQLLVGSRPHITTRCVYTPRLGARSSTKSSRAIQPSRHWLVGGVACEPRTRGPQRRRALLTSQRTGLLADLLPCVLLRCLPFGSSSLLQLVSASPDVDPRRLPKVRPWALVPLVLSLSSSPGPIKPISSRTPSPLSSPASRPCPKPEPCLDQNTPVRHPSSSTLFPRPRTRLPRQLRGRALHRPSLVADLQALLVPLSSRVRV